MKDIALVYAYEHRQQHLESLMELLRIPSVSTLPEHKEDVHKTAEWLVTYMQQMGLEHVTLISTPRHPVVYGDWLHAGEETPTLLVYGHYDVQPPDPLDKWHTPPFEPTIKDNDLFCRGVSDDKGQIFLLLLATEAYLKTAGKLPLNIKFLIEGEEEISSPHLADVVWQRQEKLACDAILICDQPMLGPDVPAIMLGVRGLAYLELTVRGPAQDLHSGSFGGGVDNPFNVLVRILGQLVDPQTHRILIPGFYDHIWPIPPDERELLAATPVNDVVLQLLAGVPAVAGEEGYTTAERISIRPTFDIHGIMGGFTGTGSKTVIPAEATAKVSMRLVPGQNPAETARLFEAYVRQLAPPTVTIEVKTLGLCQPAVIDYKAAPVQAADKAYELGIGKRPVYMRGGGSLPIVADFQAILNAPVVMMGFGLPDDNLHAPNEKLHLPNFYRGIETIIHYFECLVAAK